MADPVRARRLSDHEGQTLTQIVRRGRGSSIRVRRATMILASASGTPVAAIARLVAADEDTVRDVIHAFNAKGLAALDPQWAGGRPRLISDDDTGFIVTTATTRPGALGVPFTHWSVRKLVAYLAHNATGGVSRPGAAAPDPARAPHQLPAHAYLEGIHRSGQGRQTRPDRLRDQPLPDALLRVRPVRTARRSGPVTARPGHRSPRRSGYARRITARTASATSTAATASATTNCGVSTGAAKVGTTRCRRSSRSEPPDQTAHPST